MTCTLPYLMLCYINMCFYLNSLSKEFGKLLAFACVYNLILGERGRERGREKRKEKKKTSRPSYRSKRKEREGKKGLKTNLFHLFTFSLSSSLS